MRFGSPEYFWLLVGIPLIVGFFIWAHQLRQAALKRFADLGLIRRLTPNASLSRRVWKWVLFLLFFLFMTVALVRPRFGVKMEMVERRGVDVMVALDVSRSMLARDVTPNRIDRAKHEIGKLIGLLKGDRVGLVIFAGESYVQCPLTLDYGTANMFLEAVSTDWIGAQGTALADAIEQATTAFRSKDRKDKVLIVLSDGESHEGDAKKAAAEAAKEGVRIYTIGLGSESGVPIPLSRAGGNVTYKKDTNGDLVLTKLNSVVLEKVALEGNGKYFHAGTNLNLSKIYEEIAKMEKRDLGLNRVSVYKERYQVFLALALVFLLLEFFLPERVRRREEWKGRFET